MEHTADYVFPGSLLYAKYGGGVQSLVGDVQRGIDGCDGLCNGCQTAGDLTEGKVDQVVHPMDVLSFADVECLVEPVIGSFF